MFYHARPLCYVESGEVTQSRELEDEHYRLPFEWLEQQLGFYGIFLAVGDERIIPMTGYPNQFTRTINTDHPHLRNQVLFGFEDLPEARFTDYMAWHIPLNSVRYSTQDGGFTPSNMEPISDRNRRSILKPSWSRADWLRASVKTHDVQGHIETLDLSRANLIWCRNKDTRGALLDMGFGEDTVEVRRTKVQRR